MILYQLRASDIKLTNCTKAQEVCHAHRWVISQPSTVVDVQVLAVYNNIQDHARCLWPGCKLVLFGSRATGICSAISDIDLSVLETGVTMPVGPLTKCA